MDSNHALDHCLAFINCQLQPAKPGPARAGSFIKCVTVSRQSGCGAHFFSEELAAYLMARQPLGARPWTIFDSSLVEAVLEDHHLPARLARFMPEDRVSQLDDIIHDLFSLHPPTESLVRQTSETILKLAELGNVIIVGRGANIVTARLPGVLHVRLIGSEEQRASHMWRFDNLARKEALERIKREDTGRARYVKKYFNKDIDDPLLYHLVINTDRMSLPDAAHAVGELALKGGASVNAKQMEIAAK
jgi:cytidylate kinase